eukprot:GHVP01057738.1.p1 GENE.GHVP01057738.1~~GHVP01057738.1.p1  ORF type:complete len:694 (+),score=124.71 GHVP01057738.1:226-2082(+)
MAQSPPTRTISNFPSVCKNTLSSPATSQKSGLKRKSDQMNPTSTINGLPASKRKSNLTMEPKTAEDPNVKNSSIPLTNRIKTIEQKDKRGKAYRNTSSTSSQNSVNSEATTTLEELKVEAFLVEDHFQIKAPSATNPIIINRSKDKCVIKLPITYDEQNLYFIFYGRSTFDKDVLFLQDPNKGQELIYIRNNLSAGQKSKIYKQLKLTVKPVYEAANKLKWKYFKDEDEIFYFDGVCMHGELNSELFETIKKFKIPSCTAVYDTHQDSNLQEILNSKLVGCTEPSYQHFKFEFEKGEIYIRQFGSQYQKESFLFLVKSKTSPSEVFTFKKEDLDTHFLFSKLLRESWFWSKQCNLQPCPTKKAIVLQDESLSNLDKRAIQYLSDLESYEMTMFGDNSNNSTPKPNEYEEFTEYLAARLPYWVYNSKTYEQPEPKQKRLILQAEGYTLEAFKTKLKQNGSSAEYEIFFFGLLGSTDESCWVRNSQKNWLFIKYHPLFANGELLKTWLIQKENFTTSHLVPTWRKLFSLPSTFTALAKSASKWGTVENIFVSVIVCLFLASKLSCSEDVSNFFIQSRKKPKMKEKPKISTRRSHSKNRSRSRSKSRTSKKEKHYLQEKKN